MDVVEQVPPPLRRARDRLIWVAVGLWAAFAAAHAVLAGVWWAWLIPATLPPIGFVAVPAGLLAVAAWRKAFRAAAVSVLCLGVGVAYSGLHLPAARATAATSGISVFAWNTQYWHQDDDPDAFYAYLKRQNADIYLLQEYLGWDHSRPIDGFRPMDDAARLAREFPGYHLAARGELLTLSRYPIVAAPAIAPDSLSINDFATVFGNAKVLRTDLRVGGGTLSVYNTHIMVHVKIVNPLSGTFYSFTRDASAQRHAQLGGLEDDIAANPHPILLAGDFNTSPAMADLDRLSARMRDAIEVNGSAYPATWPARLPLWRLDWAFTTEPVQVHGYEFTAPGTLSDHWAQSLVVDLPGAKG